MILFISSAVALVWVIITMSSAYTVAFAHIGSFFITAPMLASISSGDITPPCAVPRSGFVTFPRSLISAFNQATI